MVVLKTKSITDPKIEATGLGTIFAMGVSKQVTERMLLPVVGNSTIKSGLAKLVLGGVISQVFQKGTTGKVGNVVGNGLILDGVEDAGKVVVDKILTKRTNTTNDGW